MNGADALQLVRDLGAWLCLGAGSFFLVVSAIGLLRFPDFYTRLHAAGVADTLGADLILVGLILQSPSWLVTVKLVAILLFLVLTSPTASHALANAAHSGGLVPWRRGSPARATDSGERKA